MSRGARPRGAASSALARAARRIELVLLDVDGVLTDAGIVFGETSGGEDVEIKRFSSRDGLGLTLAKAAGYTLGLLTGRTSRIVERRAREIGIAIVEQGHFDKTEAFESILRRLGLDASQALYMGDDLLDLRILTRVGLPVTVGDAPEPVRRACLYVTESRAGEGAVREVVDLLLALSGRTARAYRALGIELPPPRRGGGSRGRGRRAG